MAQGVVDAENLLVPEGATDGQLLRVHSADYLHRVKNGLLTKDEIRRVGFPWSPGLVERSRRSVGGTINACRSALQEGHAVNLAGGTHHAGRDHGEGFCVFNDVAVAARTMQAEDRVQRVIILDCDVHQGNGTAAILASDPSIFTFSIHGQKNFPFRKYPSDLDIGLEDGIADSEYLAVLEDGASRAIRRANADLAIYISGADPYVGDRLGRLSLSKDGLAERDRLVYSLCQRAGLPVATVMGGGYSKQVEDIVDIHLQTIRHAAQFSLAYNGRRPLHRF